MHLFLALLLSAAALTITGGALANAQTSIPMKQRLTPSSLVLQGQHAAQTVFKNFGAPELRPQSVTLTIRDVVLGSVDAQKSTLTVLLDGVPMKTLHLESTGPLEIDLGLPSDGFHALALKAHLVPVTKHCVGSEDDTLWAKLVDAELAWHQVAIPPKTLGVSELLNSWIPGSEVQILGALDETPGGALVYLELASWLTSRKVHLARKSEQVFEFQRDETLKHSTLEVKGRRVLLAGPSWKALQHVALGLHDERMLKGCVGLKCFVPARNRTVSISPSRKGLGTLDEVVLELSDVLARPWVSAGSGQKELDFSWTPPQDWTAKASPLVELFVRMPTSFRTGVALVSLSLNETPLESWTLSPQELSRSEGAILLTAAIPRELHEETNWNFRLSTRLKPFDDNCAWVDPSTAWLVVEGRSRLVVPRRENRRPGIKSLLAAIPNRPKLSWEAPLSTATLMRLALLLKELPSPSVRRAWIWQKQCQNCIKVLQSADATLPVRVKRVEGKRSWHAIDKDIHLPLIPIQGTAVLSQVEDVLLVTFGSSPSEPRSTRSSFASWTTLVGQHAIWSENEWIEWGETSISSTQETASRPDHSNQSPSPTSTDGEPRYWLANVLWIALIAFVATIAIWWNVKKRERIG